MEQTQTCDRSPEAKDKIQKEWYAQSWTYREDAEATMAKMWWIDDYPGMRDLHVKIVDSLGLPSRKGRPGPKPNPLRAELRKQHAAWSDRTFDTYWRGLMLLVEYTPDPAVHEAAILKPIADGGIMRPNKTFSVRKWEERCSWIAAAYDLEHDEAPGGGPGA